MTDVSSALLESCSFVSRSFVSWSWQLMLTHWLFECPRMRQWLAVVLTGCQVGHCRSAINSPSVDLFHSAMTLVFFLPFTCVHAKHVPALSFKD